MKLSAVIVARDEEPQLPALFESLKEVDDIVLVDHESIDKTASLAKEFGARVYTHANHFEISTEDDVDEFKTRYGFDAHFKKWQIMSISYLDKNRAHTYAKYDWVFFPDCDEIVTWDLDKVKKLMSVSDVIAYKFIDREHEYLLNKLYRKSKCWWKNRSHEEIYGHDLKTSFTKDMVVNHYQVPKSIRHGVKEFEFNMLKDQGETEYYYLGRAYFNDGLYERSFKILKEYLKISCSEAKIVKAYLMMARCLHFLGKTTEAKAYMSLAFNKDPTKQTIEDKLEF